jgi:hypothetical protein
MKWIYILYYITLAAHCDIREARRQPSNVGMSGLGALCEQAARVCICLGKGFTTQDHCFAIVGQNINSGTCPAKAVLLGRDEMQANGLHRIFLVAPRDNPWRSQRWRNVTREELFEQDKKGFRSTKHICILDVFLANDGSHTVSATMR